jgi:hypothetical protein
VVKIMPLVHLLKIEAEKIPVAITTLPTEVAAETVEKTRLVRSEEGNQQQNARFPYR